MEILIWLKGWGLYVFLTGVNYAYKAEFIFHSWVNFNTG